MIFNNFLLALVVETVFLLRRERRWAQPQNSLTHQHNSWKEIRNKFVPLRVRKKSAIMNTHSGSGRGKVFPFLLKFKGNFLCPWVVKALELLCCKNEIKFSFSHYAALWTKANNFSLICEGCTGWGTMDRREMTTQAGNLRRFRFSSQWKKNSSFTEAC